MSHFLEFRLARLGIPSLITCLALLAGGCSQSTDARPSILLISLDTTRADHLGVYGYPRHTTPALDALARQGLIFDNAITTSENTLISHASLFTGLYPGAHGTTYERGGVALADGYDTLAEDLKAAGYDTGGFTAHGSWLVPRFGMAQGFETFEYGFRRADVVLRGARRWLRGRKSSRPFFMFVHLFDVHSDFRGRPYEAPKPFRGAYTSGYEGPLHWPDRRWPVGSKFLQAVSEGRIALDDADLRFLIDQYDEGLSFVDNQVGAFVADLRRKHPDTWILITADHGEGFLEHGSMLHATLHDEIVRVPLIVLPPKGREGEVGAPRRVREQVRTVDLRPTLRSIAGLGPARAVQGVDLLPWLRGEVPESPAGPAPLYYRGLRADGFKLIRTAGGDRLYDLRQPGERKDLSERPEFAARLASMRALLDAQPERDARVRELIDPGEVQGVRLDPETQARLEDLGYAD